MAGEAVHNRGMGRRGISLLLLIGALVAAAPGAALARAKPSCAVPNVKGDTLAVARKSLTSAHCAVGTVKEPAAHGAVIVESQSPKAGLREKSGDKVKLTMKIKPTVLSTTKTTPVAPTPVATTPPALIGTQIFATATAGTGTSVYYVLSASLYSDATAAAIPGQPVTFSLIDGSTGQTVATFAGTSDATAGCTIVASLTGSGSSVTYTGAAVSTYAACSLGSATVPVNDSPLIGVAFAGNSTYSASVTAQSSEVPL
jgi:hypothetical protein